MRVIRVMRIERPGGDLIILLKLLPQKNAIYP